MKRYMAPVFCVVLLLTGIAINANAQAAKARTHVAAAKAAAYEPGQDFTHEYEELCVEPKPGTQAAAQPATAPAAPRIPPRSQWYVEPAKVFDNLYYVGSDNNSVWAVTTSDGIILIDTDQDYAVGYHGQGRRRCFSVDPRQPR